MLLSRPVSRALLAALLFGTAAACTAQDAPGDEPYVQITFLDVGQADAVVIRSPEGQTALIDAGRGNPLEVLREMGIEEIDLLVATHPHADHIGGMESVLNAIPVRFYMDNGQPHTTATYQRLLRTLQQRTEVTYLAAEPRMISLGSVELEVLALPPADVEDHNNRSVTLVLRFGSFSAFLSGDSEVLELDHFVGHQLVPDVTLLKAPHHGSDNGFTWGFLQASRPEVVVISVGDNSYGHPRPEALSAYDAIAEKVYRTDLDGHVTVLGYEDGRYEVLAGRNRVTLPRGGGGP
jgi:competence protein ComEC